MHGIERVKEWFASNAWVPRPFQSRCWQAYAAGKSGLLQVATGAGKTYGAYGGPLAEMIDSPPDGLAVLYITPLRAMTRDLEKALRRPVEEMDLKLRVEARTGDTGSSLRAKQRRKAPQVLLTTPESLTLLLSYPEASDTFAGLRCVIVDELHELMSSKRGVQTELGLARLRTFAPELRTWALSATLANPSEAARIAVGNNAPYELVQEASNRPVEIRTLLPADVRTLPWAGHIGLRMLNQVLAEIDPERSCVLFANTRSQAELWFEGIVSARPEWSAHMAVHHGSIDRDERDRIETGLKEGTIRLVVSTSSLDLGVDFAPVERVFQLGSPKGVSRVIQRAGRANHRPGEPARIIGVPTHTIQIMEFAAVREAVERNEIEQVQTPICALDALFQHLVTVGCSTPFHPTELYDEIRSTATYRDLDRDRFDWVISQLATGGTALAAYPEHRRLERNPDGSLCCPKHHQRRHRMMIGTITSDGMVNVRFKGGGYLGQVEEGFISRLREGDTFLFAGRRLKFLHMRDMTALVRLSKSVARNVPRYVGGRLPLSTRLAEALREQFGKAAKGDRASAELQCLEPVLDVQMKMSALPGPGQLLVESTQTRDGHHLFLFPFEGRNVHEGLGALFAFRMTRDSPATLTFSMNDYGIEILSAEPFPFREWIEQRLSELVSANNVIPDIMSAINLGEMARRQFRSVARIAGLVFEGFPHARKSLRQLQSSSGLIYDVFARYEPDNLLLQQARDEVVRDHFEHNRFLSTLQRLASVEVLYHETPRPTPLAFPLVADRQSVQLSSERLADRIERMKRQWLDTETRSRKS